MIPWFWESPLTRCILIPWFWESPLTRCISIDIYRFIYRYLLTNIDQKLTHIDKQILKHTFFKRRMSKNKKKASAASLKRRNNGLGLPIHIKKLPILLNIRYYILNIRYYLYILPIYYLYITYILPTYITYILPTMHSMAIARCFYMYLLTP